MSDVIDDLIRREGGYVNDPDDRGGCTKYGITQDTLAAWRGEPVSCADVARMEEIEARAIYLVRYVETPRLDQVTDVALRELLIDSAVQHGPAQAARFLQRALGVTADGMIGPVTLGALNDRDAAGVEDVRRDVLRQRLAFYGRLITRDPDQAKFAHGWMNRMGEFV